MCKVSFCVAALAALGSAVPAAAEIYPRVSAADGSVIARKSGEEVRFIDLDNWRGVEVKQDLLAGDTLRTNAVGSLAILFSDDTQLRMGRNTTLVVRKIGGDTSEVELPAGVIWARAKRGGSGVTVDTPAAAAAIRGTDWSLRVKGNETTLTVLEGAVELTNAQGTVVINEGEGAVARIGEAPRKYVLVDLEEREQVLLYGELRGVFSDMPVSGLTGTRSRAERQRLRALPPAGRTQEDWLALAEAVLESDGRRGAREALSHLHRPLPRALEARAKLVEAMIAGQELRYRDAAALFDVALPALPRDRRATAAYGRWYARALADPDSNPVPPHYAAYADDPAAALAEATAVAHLSGQAEAIEVLRAAEGRFPGDARLPAMRASLAYELDQRGEVREALDRAAAIDPDEPAFLLAKARFRATVSSDLDGALADLKRAVEVAPGADAAWNELGIVQHDRNAIVEANRAYARSVELNPENAALHANYARFLMDNDQLAAAKAEIDRAEALDPKSYAVLAAKGRYLLRMGKTAEAERVLLEASAVNPTYGDALIGLAIATYQAGATAEAAQALDNADRFDRDNPSISLIRAGTAVDEFRADDAIREAREALRRREARGGFYTGYDANRQTASYLGVTLQNLGLDEWGQYYGDRSFDPFIATSYLDEATEGTTSPFVGSAPSGIERFGGARESSNLQFSLFDPLGIASESIRNDLERRVFQEASLGIDGSAGDIESWGTNLTFQGTNYAGLPLSYYVEGDVNRSDGPYVNDETELDGGQFQLGFRPTLTDNFVLFGRSIRVEDGYPGQRFDRNPFDRTEALIQTLGGAWSHTLGDRNVVQAFMVGSRTDYERQIDLVDQFGPFRVNEHTDGETFTFGVSHLFGAGPITIRYGAEGVTDQSSNTSVSTDLLTGFQFNAFDYRLETLAARTYADATWEVNNDLQLQAGLYQSWFDTIGDKSDYLDPRLGVAWSPLDGHWLRAYYREETQLPSDYTLSPISTVGLFPLSLPLSYESQSRTAALRWDAEWNERFFTSVEYQQRTFDGLSLDIPGLLGSFDISNGRINRTTFAANYWIGGGLGAFGSISLNESEDTTPGLGGYEVPMVPEYVGQIGLTYVHPSRTTFKAAQTFVGERVGGLAFDAGDAPFVVELPSYSTTDASIGWKSPSGHLELNLQLLNAFDKEYDMVFGVPGPGRTFHASVKARF